MESISDVVDEVIQNCPIDVRRPLYKVWPFSCKIHVIYVKAKYQHHAQKHIHGCHVLHYEKCELYIEIKQSATSECHWIFAVF